MKTLRIPAPNSHTIANAYINQDSQVQRFFSYHPYQPDSFEKRLEQIDRREDKYRRSELVEVIKSYHQPDLWNNEVAKSLDMLAQPGTSVVIGGQQAGLLTGPLYTIYKAITIIQLARREQKRLQRPVVPVFWIAGEDHDREEVDHIWIRNRKGDLQKYVYPKDKNLVKRPISHIELKVEEMHSWLEQLAWILPDTPQKENWLSFLKKAAGEAPNWSRFFAKVIFHLFGKYGVLLLDSQDARVRKLEEPFFEKLLDRDAFLSQRVEKSIRAIEKLHYSAPLNLEPQQANFFVLEKGERQAVLREKEGFRTRDTKRFYTKEDLLRHPELLSNNVVTRTMMQEMIFPTLAFVAGPGEIAYWSTYREAFQELDLEMPIIYPRIHITLMEPSVYKRWQEFQLTWEHFYDSLLAKKEEWLQAKKPPEAIKMIMELKEKLESWYQPVLRYFSEEISSHLAEIGEKNLVKHWHQVDYFGKQADRVLREQHQIALSHWNQLIFSLQPNQKLQERVYNFITFWNSYGIEWIDELIEENLLQDNGDHIIAFL